MKHRLVLASGSPRRRELVKALDVPVGSISPNVYEGQPLQGETPERFVTRLSLDKARQVAGQISDAVILGADTAVVLDGDILGKPADADEATHMLRRLRGRVHAVVTGVTVLDTRSGHLLSAAKSTNVVIRRYSDSELAAYVASGDPFDKAGGYAVQHEGFHPAKDVQGCYPNAVGLPLCEVVSLLEKMGVRTRISQDRRSPHLDKCRNCSLRQRQEVSRT